MRVLITGSSGLVGSAGVRFYDHLGAEVTGLDNNLRATFFGPSGDTTPTLDRLHASCPRFRHLPIDVRDGEAVELVMREVRPDFVLHCAAQPSHDLAREIPLVDFAVNATGTLNLLEATRRHAPAAPFVLLSTNKVYGDAPNELPVVELDTRLAYSRPEDAQGVAETCRVDSSTHSVFEASKLAADVMAQEYARTFGLAVGVFRAGCLTGAAHAGVPLHGFLSHLVKTAVRGDTYTVIGYSGKQVRDNLHADDVIAAAEAFRCAPRPGEVYNLGGGQANSISVLEALSRVAARLGRSIPHAFVATPRLGDHRCYVSDLRKLHSHYPQWAPRRNLDDILDELVDAERVARLTGTTSG